MLVKEKDFVMIEYVMSARRGDKEDFIDTNIEEEAVKANKKDENRIYEPDLVIVGEGFFLKEAEKQIIGMKEDEWKTVTLSPDKAFGNRDPSKVKVIPARELTSKGIIPRINEEVKVRGQTGIVKAIGGGRVIVDFNHPLAGSEIIYKFHVVKILNRTKDKIAALFNRWFKALDKKEIKVTVKDSKARIRVPDMIFYMENAPIRIRGFIKDVERYLLDVEKVDLIISLPITRKEEKAKKKSTDETEKASNKEKPRQESGENQAGKVS